MQTSDDRVICNMSGDYSEPPDTGMPLLRTLSALLTGRDACAPAFGQRSALLDLARSHRVECLVARSLRSRGEDLAAWFGACGDDVHDERTLAVVDAIRTQELRRVVSGIVAADGAAPIVFKGAALAYSHYPDPWLRPRLDADILVPPSRVTLVLAALEDIGYERAIGISGTLVSS